MAILSASGMRLVEGERDWDGWLAADDERTVRSALGRVEAAVQCAYLTGEVEELPFEWEPPPPVPKTKAQEPTKK